MREGGYREGKKEWLNEREERSKEIVIKECLAKRAMRTGGMEPDAEGKALIYIGNFWLEDIRHLLAEPGAPLLDNWRSPEGCAYVQRIFQEWFHDAGIEEQNLRIEVGYGVSGTAPLRVNVKANLEGKTQFVDLRRKYLAERYLPGRDTGELDSGPAR